MKKENQNRRTPIVWELVAIFLLTLKKKKNIRGGKKKKKKGV